MSNNNIQRTKDVSVTFRFERDVVDEIGDSSEKFKINRTVFIEALIHNFKNLTDEKQREIIKKYLTKDI